MPVDYEREKMLLMLKQISQSKYDISAQTRIEHDHSLLHTVEELEPGETGNHMMDLGATITSVHDTRSTETLASTLPFGALALEGMNLVVNLMSLILFNQKVPPGAINFRTRSAYAFLLLALTVVAVTLPLTAPAIGAATAVMALLWAGVTFNKMRQQRVELIRAKRENFREIRRLKDEIHALQTDAKYWHLVVGRSTEEEELHGAYQQSLILEERFVSLSKLMQQLQDKEIKLKIDLKNLRKIHVIDKGMGLLFAKVALVGVVVSFIAPPIGFSILAGGAVAGLAYTSGRVLLPRLAKVLRLIMSFNKKEEPVIPEAIPTPSAAYEHDSTQVIEELLVKRASSVPAPHPKDDKDDEAKSGADLVLLVDEQPVEEPREEQPHVPFVKKNDPQVAMNSQVREEPKMPPQAKAGNGDTKNQIQAFKKIKMNQMKTVEHVNNTGQVNNIDQVSKIDKENKKEQDEEGEGRAEEPSSTQHIT